MTVISNAQVAKKQSAKTLSSPPLALVSQPDPIKSAKLVGLRYVRDDSPGFQRKRTSRGFSYLDAQGNRITDTNDLKRIKALAIPPSWRDVWICPYANGHLQSTGRDEKGRKQYRYHADWGKVRSQTKFNRMVAFGQKLPAIRRATDEHLRSRLLSREKVLAIVVRLLEATLIRVGNDEYAKTNQSFGLTTLQNRHVEVSANTVRFEFRGKSGQDHSLELSDRRLARAIKRCQDIPGHELFQYFDDDGERHSVGSSDVNEYLQSIVGESFSAKDFRTWAGTSETAWCLQEMGEASSKKEAQKNIREAIKHTAKQLGNRAATCRKYYVHPIVLQAYEEGWLLSMLEQETKASNPPSDEFDLLPKERALLIVLAQHLNRPL